MKKVLFLLLMLALVVPVKAALVNRYSFTAPATTAVDSVGGKNGTLMNGAIVTANQLVMNGSGAGRGAQHAALPVDVLSNYTSASFEFWYTITADMDWQRVFDFGDTDGSAGGNYIMFTPTSGSSTSRFSITTGGIPGYNFTEQWAETANSVLNAQVHIVCVYDDATSTLRLYQNGKFVNQMITIHKMAGVGHTNALLGAALYNDPAFSGSINEFRIYNTALTDAQVAFGYVFGPDIYKRVVIETTTPADGATNVAVNPTLSWTVAADITPTSYKLYVGTDPNILDPNVANIATYATIAKQEALATNSFALSGLAKEKNYYWRVDTVTASQTYQSYGYTFTTIPNTPVIITSPANQFIFAGANAVYTFVADKPTGNTSDVTVKWFKEMGDVDQELVNGAGNVTIVTGQVGVRYTSTLTFAAVPATDHGNIYYATSTNNGGTSSSANAFLYIKKLVVHYPFENNADDASGNAINGTLATLGVAPNNILPTFAAGKVGQAINLSNTYSNYVDLPDGFADFRGGITLCFWAYPTAAGNWANFISMSNGAPSDNIFTCRSGTLNTWVFRTANGGTQNTQMNGNAALVLNQWQMFTATLDASGIAKMYKNGVRYTYTNNDGSINKPEVTMPMLNNITRINNYIGKSSWNDAYFNGQLDEFRIYNYALTADEIAAQYFADSGVASCQVKPTADLNGDCMVTLDDLKELSNQWLQCGLYPATACGK